MINLLPPNYKKELQNREKWRTILNLEIFLFCFFIALGLILFTVEISGENLLSSQKILTEGEEKAIEIEKEHAKKLGISGLDKDVENINQKILQIDSICKENPDLIKVFQDLAGISPPEIYFTNISYQKSGMKISAGGFCPDREILYKFKELLEEREEFKNLNFPSSNWLNPKKFQLSFEINEFD